MRCRFVPFFFFLNDDPRKQKSTSPNNTFECVTHAGLRQLGDELFLDVNTDEAVSG